ncbi:hypothetical protein V5F34_00820 [Xanthobacter autotrophicus]|uniref:hypothetical protein n=1 Tax=Xanthobacter autotrophicus TaxID=280 RepID=UPI00372748F0
MTNIPNTNPPGPLEAPSSPSPADAGGAVEMAVPPAGRSLTEAQEQILGYMAKWKGDDAWTCAMWIAEGCKHHYDTPWAGGKLPGLVKRGLVEKGARGWYRITDSGRHLLNKEGK